MSVNPRACSDVGSAMVVVVDSIAEGRERCEDISL
jgi:hypothetical protein